MELNNFENMYFYGLQNVNLSNTGKNRLSKFTQKFVSKFPSTYERECAIFDIKPVKKVNNYKVFNGVVGIFIGDEITKACYISESPIVCDISNNVLYIKALNLACPIDEATQQINSNNFLTMQTLEEVKFPASLNKLIEDLNTNERNV